MGLGLGEQGILCNQESFRRDRGPWGRGYTAMAGGRMEGGGQELGPLPGLMDGFSPQYPLSLF